MNAVIEMPDGSWCGFEIKLGRLDGVFVVPLCTNHHIREVVTCLSHSLFNSVRIAASLSFR